MLSIIGQTWSQVDKKAPDNELFNLCVTLDISSAPQIMTVVSVV